MHLIFLVITFLPFVNSTNHLHYYSNYRFDVYEFKNLKFIKKKKTYVKLIDAAKQRIEKLEKK